jgi:hypothetical protein
MRNNFLCQDRGDGNEIVGAKNDNIHNSAFCINEFLINSYNNHNIAMFNALKILTFSFIKKNPGC